MSHYPVVRGLVTMPPEWRSRTAVTSSAGHLTFLALRDGMLRFAAWLQREAALRIGDRVALCLPKSLEAFQAIYGTLAAGGAYVGLQYQGPPARLGTILTAVRPRILLTDGEMKRRLIKEGGMADLPPILEIEPGRGPQAGHGLDDLLRSVDPLAGTAPVGPDDLAAIVFTSGSTGVPKGVMITHGSMTANTIWMAKADGMTPTDRRLSQRPMHYLSPNLFHLPTVGSHLYLCTDQEIMFPALMSELMERDRTTIWASSATALRLLLESGEIERHDLRSLRLFKTHGEALPPAVLRAGMAAFPKARFTTTYGSTEAPNVTHHVIEEPLPTDMQSLPLGPVCPDYRMIMCDEDGNEVPQGQIGEICAFGPAITSGYWNDPELTASKRLHGRPDSYRTGDLGFMAKDGQAYFVGRKDQMVKLRGHRFDLGEIEATLKRHPAVHEAVCYAMPAASGETDIVVGVKAAAVPGLEAELRRICVERLPRFAWPAHIARFDEFPLLPNRKIDRQRLRAMVAFDRPLSVAS